MTAVIVDKAAWERLQVLGAQLQTAKVGSARWKKIQEEIDQLCNTELAPRDRAVEKAWEKGRKR